MGRMLATLGARSFHAAAPTLWNSLPADIREIESLGAFKRLVKTHLFRPRLYGLGYSRQPSPRVTLGELIFHLFL